MSSSIFQRAEGRWVEILTALGIDARFLDGKHQPCPGCGGTDRFRYTKDERGGFFCGDTRANGLDLVMHVRGVDYRAACELVETVVGKDGDYRRPEQTVSERLRTRAMPLNTSRYLKGRGLVVAPGLRCVRGLEYYEAEELVGKYDAILAPILAGGQFRSYHATYLKGGRKAPVDKPRKILPGKPIRGGAVRLWPLRGATLGVAEGIETAIAARQWLGDHTPVWAALSTSGIKTFEWPKEVSGLTIFVDHDKNLAGHAASYQLAHRALLAKLHVRLVVPRDPGCDMNDVILGKTTAE